MAVIGKVLESLGYFAYQNSTFLVLFSFTFFRSFFFFFLVKQSPGLYSKKNVVDPKIVL